MRLKLMSSDNEGLREWLISTEQSQEGYPRGSAGWELIRTILRSVFQPFCTTASSGMGMGLSVCRSILDAMEGRL
jgi:phosphoglycerate-specific signal transduction histidine kinase